MKKLPKILIALAVICMVVAFILKVTADGRIIPTTPMVWLKLGGLALLFSIAISLLSQAK